MQKSEAPVGRRNVGIKHEGFFLLPTTFTTTDKLPHRQSQDCLHAYFCFACHVRECPISEVIWGLEVRGNVPGVGGALEAGSPPGTSMVTVAEEA